MVVVVDVDRPTLVLGSSQPDSVVDWTAAGAGGVDVVRRRSGGSAVLVERRSAVWVDVSIPRGDRRWDDDVGRAFHWLGDVWVEARERVAPGAGWRGHAGPMRTSRWSPLVCFAGLGPGEVTRHGRKVVGISQRRTREGALFQCCALLAWEPQALLDVLALAEGDRRRGMEDLRDVAAGAGPVPGLADSFVHALGAR